MLLLVVCLMLVTYCKCPIYIKSWSNKCCRFVPCVTWAFILKIVLCCATAKSWVTCNVWENSVMLQHPLLAAAPLAPSSPWFGPVRCKRDCPVGSADLEDLGVLLFLPFTIFWEPLFYWRHLLRRWWFYLPSCPLCPLSPEPLDRGGCQVSICWWL